MLRELLGRHRVSILSFCALVLPLFLLYAHGRVERRTTIVEAGLLRVTAPVQEAAARMLSGLEGVWTSYVALVELREDNDQLRGEVATLTVRALRAKELELENLRLRELLDFRRPRKDLRTVGAHVIGQEVSPYARVVRVALDVGIDDGVEAGMPVVAAEGLVGRVLHASGAYAEVMLTVDARSAVNVRVAGKGITGSLEGTGARDAYSARLLYLHEGAEPVAVGDAVVTSGHDKVFPPGIEVGYIRSLEERQRGLYFELQVAPAVNFSTLEEVLVVVEEVASRGQADAEDAPDVEGTP